MVIKGAEGTCGKLFAFVVYARLLRVVLQHCWSAKLMMLHHCSAKNLNNIQQPWVTLQQIPALTTGPIHSLYLWLTLEKILLQSLVPQHSK